MTHRCTLLTGEPHLVCLQLHSCLDILAQLQVRSGKLPAVRLQLHIIGEMRICSYKPAATP